MSGYLEPRYTQVPNELLDNDMSNMSEAELRVTLAVVRKTLGYHKAGPEAISYSQLMKLTGLSRQGVRDGLKASLARGRIKIAETGKRGVNKFIVNFADQSTEETRTSQASRLEVVKPVDTQKKVKKTKKEKDSVTPSGGQPDPTPNTDPKPTKAERDQLFDAFVEYGLGLKPRTPEANTQGWRVGPIISWLLGSTITIKANGGTHSIPGYSLSVSAEDVRKFFASWSKDISKPTTPAGFTSHFPTWHVGKGSKAADPVPELTPDEIRETLADMFTPIPGVTGGEQ